MKAFTWIWFGQVISMLGSGLGSFALGVWVFQRTGSVTQFSLILFFGSLPGLLLSPVAGALVDRWDRRWTMILSDFGAGLCTVAIATLAYLDRLEIWQIYILVALITSCGTFQRPAFTASITLLVPKVQLGRASGMSQIGGALSEILAPALAGALILAIHLQGVLLVDFLTFLFAVTVLLFVRIPKPERSSESLEGKSSLRGEIAYGWRFIAERPGLLGLLLFYGFTNIAVAMVLALLTPMLLTFSSAAVAGTVLSVGSVGMLVGAVVMTAWGGPQSRIKAIVGFTMVQGALLVFGGLRADATWIAAAAFLFLLVQPIVTGCDQVIWQRKVAPDVQGRVFAMRRMIAGLAVPLAFLIAGPLADRLFEPLLAEGGALAGSVGTVIGVGAGRGMGFMLSLLGVSVILMAVFAFSSSRLRKLESELPDEVPEEAADEPPGDSEAETEETMGPERAELPRSDTDHPSESAR